MLTTPRNGFPMLVQQFTFEPLILDGAPIFVYHPKYAPCAYYDPHMSGGVCYYLREGRLPGYDAQIEPTMTDVFSHHRDPNPSPPFASPFYRIRLLETRDVGMHITPTSPGSSPLSDAPALNRFKHLFVNINKVKSQ